MKDIDIVIPVRNEEGNVAALVRRIDRAMVDAKIAYSMIFIDDFSTDKTVRKLESLKQKFPIKIFTKKGQLGKAYSIIQGTQLSKSNYVCMIDADLQYPPEAIPEMLEILKQKPGAGVVIARRSQNGESSLRKLFHFCFGQIFLRFLHGLDFDVQSGLKIFKRQILLESDFSQITPWTLDLTLLLKAKELGYSIEEGGITFERRREGKSKVNLLKTSWEIGFNALKLKFKKRVVQTISPVRKNSMVGAGYLYKGRQLITHSGLDHRISALETFTNSQKIFINLGLALILAGLILQTKATLVGIVAILTVVYFADVMFNLYVVLKSLHQPPELNFSAKKINSLNNKTLPTYTILCPLYKEARILPIFVESIKKLDWPKNKLDVLLLLEEDDVSTIEAARKMHLPNYFRILVVPDSQPKTKPKACNFGLWHAKGEYLVIYDAEDLPESDQLKKAYLGFKSVDRKTVCLQAKLNYFNPYQNFLTRLFTAEYSLWFDVILTGLQSIETTIPLGGTSNHFRTKTLKELQGWDPLNVTEDCDLGARIFKLGFKTAIIGSTTYEEANSNLGNWLRQRSRWIKGYMQTYLVHMRQPFKFAKEQGIHALIFQLIIGARISFMLINPFLWLTTVAYFSLYKLVGPTIESLFPTGIFYLAVFSLVFGNFIYVYNYMIGCAKREHWSLIKYVFLIPIYWLFASLAAFLAFYQLLTKPYYWEKTKHGLHLVAEDEVKQEKEISRKPAVIPVPKPIFSGALTMNLKKGWAVKQKLAGLSSLRQKKLLFGGGLLVGANVVANFANFAFNAYLGRSLSLTDFGVLSLFTNILSLAVIPLQSLSTTISQQAAFLLGRFSHGQAKWYLKNINRYSANLVLVITLAWAALLPFLSGFFHISTILPFVIFTPVWLFKLYSSNVQGYLRGVLAFGAVAAMIVVEAVSKLLSAFVLVGSGQQQLIYLTLPISILLSVLLGGLFIKADRNLEVPAKQTNFNWNFFTATVLTGVTAISFLGLDVIIAKHYLSSTEAGEYALLSLVGKMIFFFGTLFGQFMIPIVSRNEGAKKSSKQTFIFLFLMTLLPTVFGLGALGAFGTTLVPWLLGSKAGSILPYLPFYALAISGFTLSTPLVSYFQAKKDYSYALAGFLASLMEILLLSFFHRSINQFVMVMLAVSLINLALMLLIFICRRYLEILAEYIEGWFSPAKLDTSSFGLREKKLRILIFNWRDTKHVWSGGAETYLYEMAKRWVGSGHEVTMFCGNDKRSKNTETISGIKVIRHGGFYTVYVWALVYYVVFLRNKFDFIVDSANGIPFFTPVFSRTPKVLLIHHIHQEVFRQHLMRPLAVVAGFVESKLMPLTYRNQKIVTVSTSSKREIENLVITGPDQIEIISPGVNLDQFKLRPKTLTPTLLYLGRLKPYKNVDVAIKAFAEVAKKFPRSKLKIAGDGESMADLKNLVQKLSLQKQVVFLGRVSEKQKLVLLEESWVLVQPSMIEGWGITVIEANAAGTPVIASNVNGLRDSVVNGKTGLLVKPKSITELSNAMDKLMSNRGLRENLSTQALYWSKNFDWSKSAQAFMDVVERMVEEKGTEAGVWDRLKFIFGEKAYENA